MTYDPFTPITTFNLAAGFQFERRDLMNPDVKFQAGLVKEEVEELFTAFLEDDRREVLDGIADGVVTLIGLAYRMGVDPHLLMQRINDSNMSKFCTTYKDAVASVESYQGDERYHNVFWDKVGELFVIYGEKVGGGDSLKILKGIHYQPPYLEDLL